MKTRAVVRIYGGMLLLGMADLQFGDGLLIAIFGVIGLLGFVLGICRYITAVLRQLRSKPINVSHNKFRFVDDNEREQIRQMVEEQYSKE